MTALAIEWPTDDAAYGLDTAPAKVYQFDVTPAVKAQVREICIGIKMGTARNARRLAVEERLSITRAFRSDLLKYATEVRVKPSLSRDLRHYLTDSAERDRKLIEETGFNILGEMVEPPQQQWDRPQAMTLYARLMVRDDGAMTIEDYDAGDLQHLAWMIGHDLAEVDGDGRIHLLSDSAEPDQRRYSGAPVNDDRAGVGQTHAAEEVQGFVMQVWAMIVDGHPPMDIGGDYREEMTTRRGLRMSGRMMTYQCNKLHAAWMDANCNCLGRDQVAHAWDLPDHGQGCAGRKRWFSVDVIRRAIRALMESGQLTRTDEAYLTRRNHTAHRVPAAYEIPADAGWHAYVTHRRTRRVKRPSALQKRLLGPLPAPVPDPYPVEFQDYAA
jgi:hypothetical protein